MENLTQLFGVVKPNVSPKPLSGHKVVVFKEKKGAKSRPEVYLRPGSFSSPGSLAGCEPDSSQNMHLHLRLLSTRENDQPDINAPELLQERGYSQ